MTATLPGKALAEELQAASRAEARHTPTARLFEAATSHALTEDHYFRLIGQLWAMKPWCNTKSLPRVVYSCWVVYRNSLIASNILEQEGVSWHMRISR